VVADPAPSFPQLPNAFQVDVEANIIDALKTYNVKEYYNLDVKQTRYDVITADSTTITYEDRTKNITYTVVNGNNCTVGKLPERSLNPFSLFFSGAQDSQTYIGVQTTRGVPCDTWTSQFTFSENSTGIMHYHNYTLTYFFTVTAWSFRAHNVTRKPMRCLLEGNVTYADGTTRSVLHDYAFINFVPAAPLADFFKPPSYCFSRVQQLTDILKSKNGAGLAAGMFFFGLFLGSIIVGMSIWLYCRRRQQKLAQFK